MQTASLIVYVYAVLVAAGGVVGYLKAKSLPSLVMGSLSALALLAAGYGLGEDKMWGHVLAIGIGFVLLFFFGSRYQKSNPRAFMPGGQMAILSLLMLVGVALTAHRR